MKQDAIEILKQIRGRRKKAKKLTGDVKWKPKSSKHPYQMLNWKSKKRFYVQGLIATNNLCKDNVIIRPEVLEELAQRNRATSYPVYYNFDEQLLLGQAKIPGCEKKGRSYQLLGDLTLIVPTKFAEKLSNMGLTILLRDVKEHQSMVGSRKVRVITKCKIESVSLVPKKELIDDACVIKEILKDSDIDKRLES